MELFLRESLRHIIDAGRGDLSELELRDLKLRKRGGDAIYRYLHSKIVRDTWKDSPGYPLKKVFHSKKLLVCSYPIRNIAKATGYSVRIVNEVLIEMEAVEHIIKDKLCTYKGQTVYILGTWDITKNKNEENIYSEELLRDKKRDAYIKQKEMKPKENDYSMYNFDDIYETDIKINFA